MLTSQALSDAAHVLSHRAGSWAGQRLTRVAGPGWLPAALHEVERRLPQEWLARRRFHVLYSIVGDLDAAATFLDRRVCELLRRPPAAPPAPSAAPRSLRRHDARAALASALATLTAAGITPFLSFGTLLGAVREGGFIQHDLDIDIGVFSDEVTPERLISLFRRGTELRLALSSALDESRIPVKLRHRSGASVDLVPFERRADVFITRVMHQGHVLERRRRPFGLRPMEFEGLRVMVPDPPEAFLDENYGDWRVPQVHYHYVVSSRMPFDPADPLVRYLLYKGLDDAVMRGALESARWLAGEALARGVHGASLQALANTPSKATACASTPR